MARPPSLLGLYAIRMAGDLVGDAADNPRAAFDHNEYDGFAGCDDRFGKPELRFRQRQVGYVARRFGVRAFAEAQHDDVRIPCFVNRGLYVDLFVDHRPACRRPACSVCAVILRARDGTRNSSSRSSPRSPAGSSVYPSDKATVPSPARRPRPAVVQRDQRIGGRAGDQDLFVFCERQNIVRCS